MSGNCGSFVRDSVLGILCGSPAVLAICGAAGIYAGLSMSPQEAKAGADAFLPYPTFVFRTDCALRGNVADSSRCSSYPGYPRAMPPYWVPYQYTTWEWDPPASDISSISFEFYFNPALFMPVPGSAGFLCGFGSAGASCPTDAPGSGTVPVSDTLLAYDQIPTRMPATGTQSIVIGADTVTINATFSPEVTVTGDTYFFAMDFIPLVDIAGSSIEYSQSLLPHAAYSVLSYSCSNAIGAAVACGDTAYTASFAIVPEPGTVTLLTVGALGGVFKFRSKRKAAMNGSAAV
jgi:hypothetical protein